MKQLMSEGIPNLPKVIVLGPGGRKRRPSGGFPCTTIGAQVTVPYPKQ